MRSPPSMPGRRRCATSKAPSSRCSIASRSAGKTFLTSLLRPRADRILFAATKADHLHHASHDRLEAILRRMVDRAIARAGLAGAEVDVIALAAVRATREAAGAPRRRDAAVHCRRAGGGRARRRPDASTASTEVAVFPGDLPADPDELFAPGAAGSAASRQRRRGDRFPLRAVSPAAARQRVTARRRCPIFGLTARCNS